MEKFLNNYVLYMNVSGLAIDRTHFLLCLYFELYLQKRHEHREHSGKTKIIFQQGI